MTEQSVTPLVPKPGRSSARVGVDTASELPGYRFNELDGGVDRRSRSGPYEVDVGSRHPAMPGQAGFVPLNPLGRVGIAGRGVLGRFGPNHAGGGLVTRWKRKSGMILRCAFGRTACYRAA